jgi:hypothetical protein
MKKLWILAVTAAMLSCFCVSVFAADRSTSQTSKSP